VKKETEREREREQNHNKTQVCVIGVSQTLFRELTPFKAKFNQFGGYKMQRAN
jgi:hypothetical protein